MDKYLLTYYKNETVILSISNCNKCPLLNIDFTNKSCKCRYNSYRLVKDNISNYNENLYRVFDYINIPNWCRLSNNTQDLKNSNIFKIFKNSISISKNNLDISKLKTIEYFNITDMTDFVYDYTKKSNYNNIKKINHKICSLCGEEDDNVNRNNNYGMCDSCWEISKHNEYNKKLSYINNFRLKRDIGIKSHFKFLSDIKIK